MSLSSVTRSLAICFSALTLFSLAACNNAGGQARGSAALSGPPEILAAYQARAPRKCSSVTSPPSVAQASAMVQCSMDGLGDMGLSLVQDVQIQIGTPRVFIYNSDAGLEGIDLNAKVYPLRGSYTSYFCKVVSQFDPAGQSCVVSEVPEQYGWCWKTSFGDYRCKMHPGAPLMKRGPAPTTY